MNHDLFDYPMSNANRPYAQYVAEIVYHEARHCEQWFHMARYYALGKNAVDVSNNLGIGKMTVCTRAVASAMTRDDPMTELTTRWFNSVYGRSGRNITSQALGLRRVQNASVVVPLDQFRQQRHAEYSGNLAEEVDAWGIQALVSAKFAG